MSYVMTTTDTGPLFEFLAAGALAITLVRWLWQIFHD